MKRTHSCLAKFLKEKFLKILVMGKGPLKNKKNPQHLALEGVNKLFPSGQNVNEFKLG